MTHTCTAYKRPTTKQKTYISESEGLEKSIPSKWIGNKSRGSNTYIRQNRLQNKGHKKRHRRTFLILKGRIHQEDINIVNIGVPNIGAPKYIRKILEDFKKGVDSNANTVGILTPHCEKWTDLLNKMSKRILWNSMMH